MRKVIKSILFDLCMDLTISHYSNQELIQLLELDTVTEETIRTAIQEQLSKFTDPSLQTFFNSVQERLLTDLKNRSINPEQKSTITRIIHIDSSHVPLHVENFSSDKFSFQLSDQINNVISISLLSVEIPQSWYTFSYLKGNTRCMYYYYSYTYFINTYDDTGNDFFSALGDNELLNSLLFHTVDSDGYIRNAEGIPIATSKDASGNYLSPVSGIYPIQFDSSGNPIQTIYKWNIDANGDHIQKTDASGVPLYFVRYGGIRYRVVKETVLNPMTNQNEMVFYQVILNDSGNIEKVQEGTDSDGNPIYSILYNFLVLDPEKSYYTYRVDLDGYVSPNIGGVKYNIYNKNNIEKFINIEIPDGNYSIISLLNKLTSLIHTGDGTLRDTSFGYTIVRPSGKVIFTSDVSFKFLWHDTSSLQSWLNLSYINHNLGTYLGFNQDVTLSIPSSTDEEFPYISSNFHSLLAPNVMNVNGTRYIILDLNDFSTNRISNNIVLMNSLPRNKVVINDQTKLDLPQIITGKNTTAILSSTKHVKQSQINLLNNYTYTPPTGKPLVVRQASNLFAKIPLKRNAFLVYNNITEKDEIPELGYARHFSELTGSLQGNVRDYLGPITLRNIEVSLYDDKGFLLGLNGMHWSCSIIVKSIYQKKE